MIEKIQQLIAYYTELTNRYDQSTVALYQKKATYYRGCKKGLEKALKEINRDGDYQFFFETKGTLNKNRINTERSVDNLTKDFAKKLENV